MTDGSVSKRSRTLAAVVYYGTEEIPITVDFGRRKHLYINVRPDQTVIVRAPAGEPIARVLEVVERRKPWIFEHLLRFRHADPPPMRCGYADGETLLYLGDRYILDITTDTLPGVSLAGDVMRVAAGSNTSPVRVGALVDEWYVARAREVFAGRLEQCRAAVGVPEHARAALRIRRLKRSWGNCSARGRISLSLELIKVPVPLIDYVVIHELCHLRHHNHSKDFYRLLGDCLPEWRARKEELDRYAVW